MSLTPKLDKLKKTGEVEQKNSKPESMQNNRTGSICFCFDDGRQVFFNYSSLMFGWLLPDNDAIELSFVTHKVTLKGINLSELFAEIFRRNKEVVQCENERHLAVLDTDNDVVVTGIDVTPI